MKMIVNQLLALGIAIIPQNNLSAQAQVEEGTFLFTRDGHTPLVCLW